MQKTHSSYAKIDVDFSHAICDNTWAKASYRLYSHSDMLIERALASLGTATARFNAMHFLRKLRSTLRIATCLVLARTFGRYEVSVYADGLRYVRYHWRGRIWAFPIQPLEF